MDQAVSSVCWQLQHKQTKENTDTKYKTTLHVLVEWGRGLLGETTVDMELYRSLEHGIVKRHSKIQLVIGGVDV